MQRARFHYELSVFSVKVTCHKKAEYLCGGLWKKRRGQVCRLELENVPTVPEFHQRVSIVRYSSVFFLPPSLLKSVSRRSCSLG
jgi:hypothetical protein